MPELPLPTIAPVSSFACVVSPFSGKAGGRGHPATKHITTHPHPRVLSAQAVRRGKR